MKVFGLLHLDGRRIAAATLGLALGAVATIATFKWGLEPLILLATFAPLVFLLFAFTPPEKHISIPISIGLAVGVGLPIVATTPVARPVAFGKPANISSQAGGEYEFSNRLATARECEQDDVEVWGSRGYSNAGVEGSDVVSWRGIPPDIPIDEWQPTVFGSTPMDSEAGGAKRSPHVTLCTKSGNAVTLGTDNAPDGVFRTKIWYREGSVYKSKTSGSDKFVAAATQDPGSLETKVVMRRFSGGSVWCGSYKLPTPAILAKDPPGLEWLPIRPDYYPVDYVYQGDVVYLLLVPVGADGHLGNLMIARTRCDGRPISAEQLKRSDGRPIGETDPKKKSYIERMGSPTISVGPNGEIVLLRLNDLKFRVFEGATEVISGTLPQLDYAPSRSGVYGLTEPQMNNRAWLMYFAAPKGDPNGANDENKIISVRYTRAGRCVRTTAFCIKHR